MAHKTYIRHIDGADTVVLFIHGFLGSTEHFERFISLVPEGISVYNILLDGHGGSVREFASASMTGWQNQVSSVVDELSGRYNNIIIMAHSMGTFFAMDEAIRYPDKVRTVILLQTPLKIGVKPAAAINTFKSFFNFSSDDEVSRAYRNAHSVKLNMRIWEYIGWVPRYLELFRESKRSRSTILKLDTPCVIFQSAKDELVSMKSVKFIPKKQNIKLNILNTSAHFIYSDEDFTLMSDGFSKLFV